ncbi:MAG TPA: PqqD family protein [Acidimicrobiales bacterium]|nr:PqqD family protein [Acidimicrobiales bacterium]
MEDEGSVVSTYEVASAVASRLVDGETVIVDLESEMYFGLNRVGSVVWGELQRRAPVPQIVAAVTSRFDVSQEQADADVRTLIHDLEAAGLLRRHA